jgi:hypothetical protein
MGDELYRRGNGSLVIRESWDDGLEVEMNFHGTVMVVQLDVFQARDLLRGLIRGVPSYYLELSGPAER